MLIAVAYILVRGPRPCFSLNALQPCIQGKL